MCVHTVLFRLLLVKRPLFFANFQKNSHIMFAKIYIAHTCAVLIVKYVSVSSKKVNKYVEC